MPSTKSVQVFKDESVDLDARIIAAIGIVGPRNVARISRLTGAHQETIRYKIKKRFANRGFEFQADVDFSKLGLVLHWGTFQISPFQYDSAPGLFTALSKVAYLVHFSKILPQGHYTAIFALPEGRGADFTRFLEGLKSNRLIVDFKLDEVVAERHKPMDPTFYNFQSNRWEVDWAKVRASPGTQLSVDGKTPTVEADETDLLIIKELQNDALQHVSRIAKKLKIHEKTMEYHYRTHVNKMSLIPRYRVRWIRDKKRTLAHSTMVTQATFKGLDDQEFKKVQRTVSRIPFLWVEDLLKDGTYIATMNIPVADFIETMSYVNGELQFLGPKVETGYMRVGDSQNFTIPYELFDDKAWKFDVGRMTASITKEIKSHSEK